MDYLTQTAKAHATAGATAGVILGLYHGILSVQRFPPKDRYGVVSGYLTHAGTGAIIGILGATVATVSGISAAAIAGRGILTIMAPILSSAMVTSAAYGPVLRFIRPLSEDLANGLRQAFGQRPTRRAPLKLPSA